MLSQVLSGTISLIGLYSFLQQARDFGKNRALPYQDVANMLSQILGGRNVPYGQIFNALKQGFGKWST